MAGGQGYRADIDGLRAVAVLAVVGYHFFPAVARAGFIGVDIFFVISGYLITGILQSQVAAGRFSLAGFYGRRIRRIFPALAVVLAACAVLGWQVLYQDEYRLLGNHIAASAGFVENLLLWSETGYFDAAAETKPLLHLWSLGVEEQFYLAWPLVFALACRSPRWRRRTTAAVLVASLAACIAFSPGHPIAAFYAPMFRFWEIMAGALLVQHPGWTAPAPRRADAMSWAGVLLLAACPLVIQSGANFPGWRAVLPVAAACLLVAAGPQAVVNRTLLSHRWVVAVGLVSYPLYLWHWPLLTFLRIASNDAPLTLGRGTALFAVSLLLAWLTYALAERPVRRGGRSAAKAGSLALVMLCVGLAGWRVAANAGFPQRPVNSRDPTFASRDGRNATDVRAWLIDDCRVPVQEAALFRRCTRDGRGTERFALIGDSKAEALWAGLVRTSSPQGRWLFIGGSTSSSSVLPVWSDAYHYETYRDPSRLALQALAANRSVQAVAVVAATRAFFHLASADSVEDLSASPFFDDAKAGFVQYVRQLVAAGKRVVLVVDNPTLPDPKRCMTDARITWHGRIGGFFAIGRPDPRCEITLQRHLQLTRQYRHLLDAAVQVDPARVTLFDTVPLLCDVPRGRCGSFQGSTLLYSFADHISDEASTQVGRALNAYMLSLAGPAQ